RLPYAEAGYRASVHARHGGLLAGTREALLAELDDWATCGSPGQRECAFFILTGGAGTGKSTIAFEVARRAEAAGRLGASFFFMRGSALLSSAESVFPTMARQLVANAPVLAGTALPAVLGHLKHGARQNLDQQAKDLFTGLLSSLPHSHPPIVIVVDAVDECIESEQDLVCRMLFLMMGALSNIPCPIRVFVTSRPEVHIEDAFASPRFTSARKFVLHEIPRPVIDADIRLFFRSMLASLPPLSHERLVTLYPDAPDDLTDLSAGLFIYATTAMEFLKQFRSSIARGMEQLIETGTGAVSPLQRLDRLYEVVLSAAFPEEILRLLGHRLQEFLGCIATLQDQISPEGLAILRQSSLQDDILPVAERLGAVITYNPKDLHAPMQLLHASFAEFLLDPQRCSKPAFSV
ncbi:hypothetical protein AURDEDRAFT_32117, partial [Auricularia subglabra TFB-10046 SS5]